MMASAGASAADNSAALARLAEAANVQQILNLMPVGQRGAFLAKMLANHQQQKTFLAQQQQQQRQSPTAGASGPAPPPAPAAVSLALQQQQQQLAQQQQQRQQQVPPSMGSFESPTHRMFGGAFAATVETVVAQLEFKPGIRKAVISNQKLFAERAPEFFHQGVLTNQPPPPMSAGGYASHHHLRGAGGAGGAGSAAAAAFSLLVATDFNPSVHTARVFYLPRLRTQAFLYPSGKIVVISTRLQERVVILLAEKMFEMVAAINPVALERVMPQQPPSSAATATGAGMTGAAYVVHTDLVFPQGIPALNTAMAADLLWLDKLGPRHAISADGSAGGTSLLASGSSAEEAAAQRRRRREELRRTRAAAAAAAAGSGGGAGGILAEDDAAALLAEEEEEDDDDDEDDTRSPGEHGEARGLTVDYCPSLVPGAVISLKTLPATTITVFESGRVLLASKSAADATAAIERFVAVYVERRFPSERAHARHLELEKRKKARALEAAAAAAAKAKAEAEAAAKAAASSSSSDAALAGAGSAALLDDDDFGDSSSDEGGAGAGKAGGKAGSSDDDEDDWEDEDEEEEEEDDDEDDEEEEDGTAGLNRGAAVGSKRPGPPLPPVNSGRFKRGDSRR